MHFQFQCKCGALRGQLAQPALALRGVCYCKDCRAYANHLGVSSQTHDDSGGVAFVATQAKYVTFTYGIEQLACLSLSEKGLLRWYAKCCNTPIAGTPRNWKFPYVGLVHTCMQSVPESFEHTFHQLQMRVNTKSTKHAPSGMALKTMASLAGFIPRVAADGLLGAYKNTPFFTATGEPIATVTVLSSAERQHAYRDV